MIYTSIFHNETSENTYLLYDENTKNGVIIDPGCKIEKILEMISENSVNIKYILRAIQTAVYVTYVKMSCFREILCFYVQ